MEVFALGVCANMMMGRGGAAHASRNFTPHPAHTQWQPYDRKLQKLTHSRIF